MKLKILGSASVIIATALVSLAAAPANDTTPHQRGQGRHQMLMAQLGLSDTQKEQIRNIRREFQPTMQPLVKQYFQERRALRELTHTTPVNEGAIRAQAARVAQAEADLAVKRAYLADRIRLVLTPEQAAKLKELQAQRAEYWKERRGRRFASQ